MKRFVRNRRRRITEAEQRTKEIERELEQVRRQWPEVRRLASAARAHREANHLSELFLAIHREK